jgi:glucose-6-phosphate dehydrogenase assembly protein OpcA
MEDAVNRGAPLLPDGQDVPFEQMTAALSKTARHAGRASGARALIATVVAVGPAPRLQEPAAALHQLGTDVGLRSILIAIDRSAGPVHRVQGDMVALGGLKPRFVNNAVAALRLSSLPTVVWWRGGDPELLPELARLADRVVLDEEAPEPGWRRAATLFGETSFSDLRWTRLTRWRTLMAQIFEMPEVRRAAARFTSLEIAGSDELTSRLYGAWLRDALGSGALRLRIERAGRAPLESVRLGDGAQSVALSLSPSGACMTTQVRVEGHDGASKTVSFGEQGPAVLLAEELRVRARDRAFERALEALLELQP